MSVMQTSVKGVERLYQTIAQVLDVEVDELSDEVSLDALPTWDSLNHLNLIMALESEFGVNLTAEDALNMRSVGAMRELLRGYGAEI